MSADGPTSGEGPMSAGGPTSGEGPMSAERPTTEETLVCIVEIPKGSRNKYEYDPLLGGIKLDRFVSASVVYPTDYGFVPETLALDGDPLDVLVCVSEPTFPGCIVTTQVVGLFRMSDEKGQDDHVLCVPCQDPGWNTMKEIDDLPAQLRREISHFFAVYKDLDIDRHSEVQGWGGRADAWVTIAEARERYRLGHEPAGIPS